MRLIVAGLAVFGLVTLFSSGAGAVAGVGLLILAPIFFILKIMFFMMLFGVFAKGFARRRHYSHRRGDSRSNESFEGWADDWSDWKARWEQGPNRRRRSSRSERRSQADHRPSDTERFEEWHRMAHARNEVDSWVDPQMETSADTPTGA